MKKNKIEKNNINCIIKNWSIKFVIKDQIKELNLKKENVLEYNFKKENIQNAFIAKGDCLKLFKNIPDKSIDMILCDLPYGVTANEKDIVIPFDQLWEGYNRIIKDNGAIVLFAQGIFYVDLVYSNKKMFRYDLVWDKILSTGFLNANRMPLRVHEQIAVFYKHLPTYNPQKHKGIPLHSKGTKYKEKECVNNNYKGYNSHLPDDKKGNIMKHPVSVISCQKPTPATSKHRTQKPVSLLEFLIESYTNENDIVLDNCFGSAPTIIAALNKNRKVIGFEKDKEIFDNSKQFLVDNYKTKITSAIYE